MSWNGASLTFIQCFKLRWGLCNNRTFCQPSAGRYQAQTGRRKPPQWLTYLHYRPHRCITNTIPGDNLTRHVLIIKLLLATDKKHDLCWQMHPNTSPISTRPMEELCLNCHKTSSSQWLHLFVLLNFLMWVFSPVRWDLSDLILH